MTRPRSPPIASRPPPAGSGKIAVVPAQRPHRIEQRHGRRDQRHHMFAVPLHPASRNTPLARVRGNLAPRRKPGFGRARRRQDLEPQAGLCRQRRAARVDPLHRPWRVRIRHAAHVLAYGRLGNDRAGHRGDRIDLDQPRRARMPEEGAERRPQLPAGARLRCPHPTGRSSSSAACRSSVAARALCSAGDSRAGFESGTLPAIFRSVGTVERCGPAKGGFAPLDRELIVERPRASLRQTHDLHRAEPAVDSAPARHREASSASVREIHLRTSRPV